MKGVSLDGLAACLKGVAIILLTLFYGNRDMLQRFGL